MSRPRHQREMEKSIRSTIRLRMSVEGDRLIDREIELYRYNLANNLPYELDAEKVLRTIGEQDAKPFDL